MVSSCKPLSEFGWLRGGRVQSWHGYATTIRLDVDRLSYLSLTSLNHCDLIDLAP